MTPYKFLEIGLPELNQGGFLDSGIYETKERAKQTIEDQIKRYHLSKDNKKGKKVIVMLYEMISKKLLLNEEYYM